MFPGGRSSQHNPSGYPSSYYGNSSAVSNPDWFQPTPVPPPVQYPPRAESGRDLLAESYERMRNEMRSLQGSSSSSKHGSKRSGQPPPAPVVEEKANPLTQLLENKDVSLSSLLEAAMDPAIGSNKRTEDPIMKKTILDKCEGKIAQLYRLRISGQGMFFPMTDPKSVKFDGVSTLTYNHPRIEFNMVPEERLWTCPDVIIETKKEETFGTKEDAEGIPEGDDKRNETEKVNDVNPSKPYGIETIERPRQMQQLPNLRQPPPNMLPIPMPVLDVSVPPLVQYPARADLTLLARAPSTLAQVPMDLWTELEKERRRKEIESEWDRLMQDKERKEKKLKKKKKRRGSRSRSGSQSSSSRSGDRRSKSRRSRSGSRYRSRSRGRRSPIHRRSHSRHRSRGRSRDRRRRHRSRSISFSPSPQHRRPRSPLRMKSPRRHRQSPSPRLRRASPSFLRSISRPSPPRYEPPRPAEEYYPPTQPYPYNEATRGPPDDYYNYGSGSYPPDSGMRPLMECSSQYGPMGPGAGPWSDSPYGPPMGPRGPGPWMGPRGPGPMGPWGPGPMGPGGPGPWMGPGPGPRWLGPQPMPPSSPEPPPTGKSVSGAKQPRANLIDVTLRSFEHRKAPAAEKPVVVVDITDDNDNVEKKPHAPAIGDPKAIKDDEKKDIITNTKPIPPVVDKAKVISNIAPPGVSPERETHKKYPNVESEFTKPMRTKFRKMLEPLSKVLDKIRLYQRDSFDFKTLIKSLEAGKVEFMGVHTLHDGLLCKLEINRKHPDKFFKIVLPTTHMGRFLRALHQSYHEYSIGKIQRLIDDLFSDPHEFPLAKIVGAFKSCEKCIENEKKEREELRKKEVLILSSPEPDKNEEKEPKDSNGDDPMAKPRDGHRRRSPDREPDDRDRKRRRENRSREHSRRPSDSEREGKSRRDSEKERSERSKGERRGSGNEHVQKSPSSETYSKFEDLSVGKADRKKKSSDSHHGVGDRDGKRDSKIRETEKKSSDSHHGKGDKDGKRESKIRETEEKKNSDSHHGKGDKDGKRESKIRESVKDIHAEGVAKGQKNGKKVQVGSKENKSANSEESSCSADKISEKKLDEDGGKMNAAKKTEDKDGGKKDDLREDAKKSAAPPKMADKPQPKPTINPADFKERVRSVQMGVTPLDSHISDLEGLGKKSSDPTLLLKAGMLCRRLPPPSGQGKPEVKIVVVPECLKQMVEIVHTMAVVHAPYQKTVTVFNKHFVPIDGLDQVVSEVLNSCEKCSAG